MTQPRRLPLTGDRGVDAVHDFWSRVWMAPHDYDAIDELVAEDFVLVSGGQRIEGREAFKEWARAFGGAISNPDFEVLETFQNADGTRVASRWRLRGEHNGALGLEPTGAPIDLVGTAVWAVREDGKLLSNHVERNALEVYRDLTASA